MDEALKNGGNNSESASYSHKRSIGFSKFKMYTGLMFLVVFIIFLLQNLEPTTFDFLFWSFLLPKLFMYLLMFVLGGIVGFILRSSF